MVKFNPPTQLEIELMQKFYDEGHSLRDTQKQFKWSRVTLIKYLKTRNAQVSDEEKRRRRVEFVVSWRQRAKKKLVEYKGGKCEICGYNKCIDNLTFHHLDPSQKDFQISGASKAFETLKKEVDKCQMLCRNCHGEIHSIKNLIPS
jgi:hypothetical protein